MNVIEIENMTRDYGSNGSGGNSALYSGGSKVFEKRSGAVIGQLLSGRYEI